MADSRSPIRPRAFRLDDADVRIAEPEAARPAAARDVLIEAQPDAFATEGLPPERAHAEIAVEVAQRRGIFSRHVLSWGGLFWSAAGALVSLAVGLWFDRLIDDFFAQSQTLGWIGVALAGLALLALVVLAGREFAGLFRQRHIASLHTSFATARAHDDRDTARKLTRELVTLYASRPEMARTRADAQDLTREIVDGRDLIDIAERTLMHPLDGKAQREVAAAARRVSVVTAISPRALVDVLFVAAQAVRLIRRIAEIYGGRPGFLGFIRLAKSVGAHLAITGGMAVGDSIVQQALGHGIASKISARLGEGVLNGMLTTRVGLSAMAVCRPMPFAVDDPPGVRDVAPFLFKSDRQTQAG